MKTHPDKAVAEVRSARRSLCDRFGNNPSQLLAHLRSGQRQYRGRIVRDWSELESNSALREMPSANKRRTK